MTNNLKKLEKDLKAFAKRCKDFKYTEQALLAFLLGGIFGFSETTAKSKTRNINFNRRYATRI